MKLTKYNSSLIIIGTKVKTYPRDFLRNDVLMQLLSEFQSEVKRYKDSEIFLKKELQNEKEKSYTLEQSLNSLLRQGQNSLLGLTANFQYSVLIYIPLSHSLLNFHGEYINTFHFIPYLKSALQLITALPTKYYFSSVNPCQYITQMLLHSDILKLSEGLVLSTVHSRLIYNTLSILKSMIISLP